MSIPKHYMMFKENYKDVADAYEAMGDAVHRSGPLDDKTRALPNMMAALSWVDDILDKQED